MDNAKLKMKKVAFITVLLFVCLAYTSAQNVEANQELRKNAVFLEAGGSALWYSLNYEHRLSLKTEHRLIFGGGVSWIPAPFTKNGFIIGVLSAGYLYGDKHNLEIGGSAGNVFTEKEFVGSFRIGYRYEGLKGFLFRVGFSPIFGKFNLAGSENGSKGVLPWGYLSFGYAF